MATVACCQFFTHVRLRLKCSQKSSAIEETNRNSILSRESNTSITLAMAKATKKTSTDAFPVAANKNISGKMGDLDQANERLNATLEEMDHDRANQINKLQGKETELLDRLSKLDDEKHKIAEVNGNIDVSDDDLVEINAGGKLFTVKRGTLKQLPDSRLAVLFSGRWDKKLARDDKGRIFLDVNSKCFQAIVDYLNELAISSEDDAPALPSVDDELQHILAHQMNIFGLNEKSPTDSSLLNGSSDAETLHNWLKEDGSDGKLELLYSSSRDGVGNHKFHSKCDNKGPTVVIIKSVEGGVIGGYTNTSWSNSTNGRYSSANKAFLFALSGFGLSSPCKMKLRSDSLFAIFDYALYGPTFGSEDSSGVTNGEKVNDNSKSTSPVFLFGQGYDLKVDVIGNAATVCLNIGKAYECERVPSNQLSSGRSYYIKEMEVFRVVDNPAPPLEDSIAVEKVPHVDTFSKKVNDAINNKWTALQKLEVDVLLQEENFKQEEQLIKSFGSDDANDVVTLNVSGTMMATSRQTLILCKDSMLAKLTEQESTNLSRVKDWNPDDVTNWVRSLKDVPDDVASLFWENEIKGSELLALDKEGLRMVGVKRTGTICLLYDEIKQLKEASQHTATLIEHSPYCFGKIIDYLRLKHYHNLDLIDEPSQPVVCESQKKRFEKIVKYYFPGDSAKFILG